MEFTEQELTAIKASLICMINIIDEEDPNMVYYESSMQKVDTKLNTNCPRKVSARRAALAGPEHLESPLGNDPIDW